MLEEIYGYIEDRPMILLTIILPYMMQEKRRNEAIVNFAAKHENCYIAD